jgi:hypothetical protein
MFVCVRRPFTEQAPANASRPSKCICSRHTPPLRQEATNTQRSLTSSPVLCHRTPAPPQAAAGAALQLAQQGAAGASDGLRGLLAPLALFGPEAGTTNVLFWVVMLLFCYNLLVLTPRQ